MTTVPSAPLAPADAPPARPAGYGLLAAAAVLPAPDNAALFGVEWEPAPCSPARHYPAGCDNNTPRPPKTFNDYQPRSASGPLPVYWGYECGTVGADVTDAIVRTGLAQGEGRAVEAAVWDLLWDTIGTGPDMLGVGRGVVDAIGHLEEELGNRLGALGIIHAPRRMAAHATAAGLVRWDGPVPRSPSGHAWCFGSGYDPGTGGPPPDGAALVATGPMTLWRTPVLTLGPILDRSINRYVALAERTYLAGWDCAAVAMTIPLSA